CAGASHGARGPVEPAAGRADRAREVGAHRCACPQGARHADRAGRSHASSERRSDHPQRESEPAMGRACRRDATKRRARGRFRAHGASRRTRNPVRLASGSGQRPGCKAGGDAMSRRRNRQVPFTANPLLRVSLPAYRSQLLMLFVAVGFVALAARAVWLQVFSQDFLQRQGESRYARTIELPASRGKIFDRNGVVLASSLPARAVWASPEDVRATPEQIAELSRLLGMPRAQLERRLADSDRTFVYLRRQVDPEVARKIAELGIP